MTEYSIIRVLFLQFDMVLAELQTVELLVVLSHAAQCTTGLHHTLYSLN